MPQKTQVTPETEALAKRRKAKLSAALKANLVRRKAAKNAHDRHNTHPDHSSSFNSKKDM